MSDAPAYSALIDVGCATHVGHVRETNEDSCVVLGPRESPPPLDGTHVLVAVADGMGGHNAGEVASHVAVTALREWLTSHSNRARQAPPAELLARAVEWANRAVWQEARADASRQGMGTTLVCALLDADGQVVIANVGDSRAYVVARGVERQITADHSWVEEQVRAGRLTEEDAQLSPYRHVLSRSLGVSSGVDVDVYQDVRLQPGEALVLCSDGITMYLKPHELAGVVDQARTAQEAAERLVQLALSRGGADNATAAVARRTG